MDDDDKVTKLPIRFKNPLPSDRSIMRLWEAGERQSCDHLRATYLIGDGEAEVTCGRCKEKLDPMWVLHQLATQDRRMAEAAETYQAEQQRLAERKRTKCQN